MYGSVILARWTKRFIEVYERVCALREFDAAPLRGVLILVLAIELFLVYFLFGYTAGSVPEFLAGKHTCFPFFPSCGEWYVLPGPDTQPQRALSFVLMTALLGGMYAATRGKIAYAHAALLSVWVPHAALVLLFAYDAGHVYDYLALGAGAVVLFARHKMAWLQAGCVGVLVSGGAFLLLIMGSPVAPGGALPTPFQSATPFLYVYAALLGIAGPLYFFAPHKEYRRLFFLLIGLCIAYAGVVFESKHALVVLPLFVALCGSVWYAPLMWSEVGKKAVVCAVLLTLWQGIVAYRMHEQGMMCARPHGGLQIVPTIASCTSSGVVTSPDGHEKAFSTFITGRPCQCDAYTRWFELTQQCLRSPGTAISWKLDVARGGLLPIRTAEASNVCETKFRLFGGNPWITGL